MRHLIFTLLIWVSTLTMNAQVYKSAVFAPNNSVEFSIHSGVMGQWQHVRNQGFGFGIGIYGVYIDYLFWGRAKDMYFHDLFGNDKTENFHVGYRFPITSWLKLTPLIGYSYNELRGHEIYSWDNVYHKLVINREAKKVDEGFDFGAQASINLYSNENVDLVFHGTLTKYCKYCGFGINIKLY